MHAPRCAGPRRRGRPTPGAARSSSSAPGNSWPAGGRARALADAAAVGAAGADAGAGRRLIGALDSGAIAGSSWPTRAGLSRGAARPSTGAGSSRLVYTSPDC